MDESETLELLGMYMDLSEKQEEVIGQLAGIVRRQAERIREMESVGGFFAEGGQGDSEAEKIIEDYRER